MARHGVLLVNVGTPDSYQTEDVARYLKEFLMDDEIISIPFLFRYILVHAIIVPKRAANSAKLYKAIWSAEGSPLRIHSVELEKNLQQLLGADYLVKAGMRFGAPSILDAMTAFQSAGLKEVIVVPLFPQYARATTESGRRRIAEHVRQKKFQFKLKEVPAFYADLGFITALAEKSGAAIAEATKASGGKPFDHYLMTYHGLPESQIKKNSGCLENVSCCERQEACNLPCYRAQCYQTSKLIAKAMNLPAGSWSVSFQSRLGKTEWIKPYTEDVLQSLPKKGIKNLAVMCPSFVADCLETLEEIGVQGAKTFVDAGGDRLFLVPCLNAQADYLAPLVEREAHV